MTILVLTFVPPAWGPDANAASRSRLSMGEVSSQMPEPWADRDGFPEAYGILTSDRILFRLRDAKLYSFWIK
jgi:hypothetical protein